MLINAWHATGVQLAAHGMPRVVLPLLSQGLDQANLMSQHCQHCITTRLLGTSPHSQLLHTSASSSEHQSASATSSSSPQSGDAPSSSSPTTSQPGVVGSTGSLQTLKVPLPKRLPRPGAASDDAAPSTSSQTHQHPTSGSNKSIEQDILAAQHILRKLVGGLTKEGKKGMAEKIVRDALRIIQERITAGSLPKPSR